MGLFEEYLLIEGGMTPADRNQYNIITKQIQTIDNQIQAKVGPVGKGKLMQMTGDEAGHINDKDPAYMALVNRRAMLVAKKMKLMAKAEK